MTRLSPQRRDLITVALLVIILLSTLPLLSSLFSERVPPPPTSTPTPTVEPTSTVESYIAPIMYELDHANLGITSLASNSMLSRSFLQKLVMNVCTPTSL